MPLGSPENPQVAIDGRNMVVVSKDTNLDYVYVVFYSLEDDDWVQKTSILLKNISLHKGIQLHSLVVLLS